MVRTSKKKTQATRSINLTNVIFHFYFGLTRYVGKRYAYKFDFAGLAAATQPQATDASYKYQSDLFMSPYHGAKLSSFMSPHHSMASSSGKFTLFSDGKQQF